jgi:DNA-binding Lrp family transcriptional regulator
MFEVLDLKDRKILYELDMDARQPISSIAKKTRISRQNVNYRINRLVNKNVIKQFVMMLDTQKIGYSFYDLFIELQDISKEKEEEFIQFLKSMDTVGWMASTMGKWDFVIAIFTRNNREFKRELDKIYSKFGKYIKNKVFIIDISAFSSKSNYLFEEDNRLIDDYYGNDEKFDLDLKDINILKALDKNPRITYLEISQKTKIAYETVKSKIQRMKKEGVIQGFKVKINPFAFGYEWHLVLFDLMAVSEIERLKFIEHLRQNMNVVFIINTVGKWNLMVDVHVKSHVHFKEFILSLKEQFGHLIKSYENLTVTYDHKTTYMPKVFSEGS